MSGMQSGNNVPGSIVSTTNLPMGYGGGRARFSDPFMNSMIGMNTGTPRFSVSALEQPINPYVPSVADLFPSMQMNPMQAQINPMSFGAARFLQGNTAPMLDYGMPQGAAIPQFNMPRYQPMPYDDYLRSIEPPPAPEPVSDNGGGA
jgi:hypothetical protein